MLLLGESALIGEKLLILLMGLWLMVAIVVIILIEQVKIGSTGLNMLFSRKRNELFYHNTKECGRMFRRYQAQTLKDTVDCPHCNGIVYLKKSEIEDEKWKEYHADCKKLNAIEYLIFRKKVKQIKNKEKDIESLNFFEYYNQRPPNVDWVKNYVNKK